MTILACNRWVVSLDDEDLEEDVNMTCVPKTDAEDWIIEHSEHGKLSTDRRYKREI